MNARLCYCFIFMGASCVLLIGLTFTEQLSYRISGNSNQPLLSHSEQLQAKVVQSPKTPNIPSLVNNKVPLELWKYPQCFRQVLIWRDDFEGPSRRDFICPGFPCNLRLLVNTEANDLKSSDAVLFFNRAVWDWDDMHRRRPPGQKWIFYSHESPIHTTPRVIPPKIYLNNTYDYTMTFRQEADIYIPYGRYNAHLPTSINNFTLTDRKTKLVAWMGSHCHPNWNRTGFVLALRRHIPVSMYGGCGDEPCPRDGRCFKKLRQHKFYLALENSCCREYITEKLWLNAFMNNIVPIVYGAPREDYERLLPPNSFIHVLDFKSVKELASYLRLLDSDDGRYMTYFEWKKLGSVQRITYWDSFEPIQVCNLIVSRLLADENAVRAGTYEPAKMIDWDEWWIGSCLKIHPQNPIDIN